MLPKANKQCLSVKTCPHGNTKQTWKISWPETYASCFFRANKSVQNVFSHFRVDLSGLNLNPLSDTKLDKSAMNCPNTYIFMFSTGFDT